MLLSQKSAAHGGGTKVLPRLNMIYALNYDRLGDSVQAKAYIEKYFATAPVERIEPSDYDFAIKVLSKFPGNEAKVVTYIEKALANDTSKVNKLNYMAGAADMFAKAKMYPDQLKWIQRQVDLKGGPVSEVDYYKMTSPGSKLRFAEGRAANPT